MATELRRAAAFLLAAVAIAASGCATPPTDPAAKAAYDEANDPIEPFNRDVFGFNKDLDHYVLRPVAKTYRDVVPDVLRDSLTNFLHNLRSPLILTHDLLQGEPARASITFERFLINSTAGIAGFLDLSGDYMGLPFHDEDFGQTLAVWGAGEGPYLVLPILGPSNVRDALGYAVDTVADPVSLLMQAHGITYGPFARAALAALDLRARNIDTLDQLESSSIDYYATLRSLYRQRRQEDIRNGHGTGKEEGPITPAKISGGIDEIAPPPRAAAQPDAIAPPPRAAPLTSEIAPPPRTAMQTSDAAAATARVPLPDVAPAPAPTPLATPGPSAYPQLVTSYAYAPGSYASGSYPPGLQQVATPMPAPASEPPAPMAIPSADPGPQAAIVVFAENSARLSERDRVALKNLAEVALASDARVLVVGRANDQVASADSLRALIRNFDLSGQRADTVANELRRNGIAGDRITIETTGEPWPGTAPAPAVSRAANRRVDIVLQ